MFLLFMRVFSPFGEKPFKMDDLLVDTSSPMKTRDKVLVADIPTKVSKHDL